LMIVERVHHRQSGLIQVTIDSNLSTNTALYSLP
jgi:hypothetical protein